MTYNNTMIRDGVGNRREFGNPRKAAKWAARDLGVTVDKIVVLVTWDDTRATDYARRAAYWCLAEDAGYFEEWLTKEGLKIIGRNDGAAVAHQK